MKPDPSAVELILTTECNLDCAYCFRTTTSARRMSWATAKHAADVALRSNRRRVEISLTGGEPILAIGMIRRLVDYVESARGRRPIIDFRLTTNGTRLERHDLGYFAEHGIRIDLSLDGIRAAQDQRQPGTFERLDDLLVMVRSKHPEFLADRVRVCCVVTSANVRYLAESVDYLIDRGVRHIRASPLVGQDVGWTMDHEDELDRQCGRVVDRCVAYFRDHRDVPVVFLQTPTSESGCDALSGSSVCFDVDGSTYDCHMFARSHGAIPGGELGDQIRALDPGSDWLDRPAPPLFRAPDDRTSIGGRCVDCPERTRCWPCPVAVVRIPGNTDPHRVPDAICAFHRVTSRHRRAFQERLEQPYIAARALWPERVAP